MSGLDLKWVMTLNPVPETLELDTGGGTSRTDTRVVWQELTTERIVAEADLKKQLGTLRYLQGLKAARQRLAAAAQGAVDPKFQSINASCHNVKRLSNVPNMSHCSPDSLMTACASPCYSGSDG